MDYFLEDDYSGKTYSEIQSIIEEKFRQKKDLKKFKRKFWMYLKSIGTMLRKS